MSNYISIPPYKKEWDRLTKQVIRNRPWVIKNFSMHDKRFYEKVAERWAWGEIIRRRKLYPKKDVYSIVEETSLDFYNLWTNSKVKGVTSFQYGVANDFLIFILDNCFN